MKRSLINLKPIILSVLITAGTVAKTFAQNSTRFENRKNYSKELLSFAKTNSSIQLDSGLIEYSDFYIEEKADELCNKYIENVLATNKKLYNLSETKYGTKTYKKAVRTELPGAPVGQHCMFGQYTQLKRALYDFNADTLKLIPSAASSYCQTFKDLMRKKYSDEKYNNSIKEGKLYKTKQEYNAALEKFIASHTLKMDVNNSDILKLLENKFAKNNFTADELVPGTILIVPRYWKSTNLFHAIVFIGRGYTDKNNNFIASENGEYMFAANNREKIGNLFSWNMNNVFMANIKQIATVAFTTEFNQIKKMSKENLITYLSEDVTDALTVKTYLQKLDKNYLLNLALYKYFGQSLPEKNPIRSNTPVLAMVQFER